MDDLLVAQKQTRLRTDTTTRRERELCLALNSAKQLRVIGPSVSDTPSGATSHPLQPVGST